MTSGFDRVLERYQRRADEERRLFAEHTFADLAPRMDSFLLQIGREPAEALRALAVARDAKCLVELGTSYGYSTLFLADAARTTDGVLHTFELSAAKQAYARAQLEEAGLAAHVRWRQGDAVELLAAFEDAPDFVLIDLWKDRYIPCFEALYPKLADDALIAADNMLLPVETRLEAERYRAHVRSKPDIESLLLPIGSGVELSRRIGRACPPPAG